MRYKELKLKDVAAVQAKLGEFLRAHGGELTEPPEDPYHSGRWTLPTVCGPLAISLHVDDASLYCRFQDTPRAVTHLSRFEVNPFSGKWNCHPDESTVATAFADIKRHLERVLTIGGVS